jgi:phosphohistidine phosphatase
MVDQERTLVLLRHAKSDWPEGVADIERPLADRGRRDAPVAGRWLRERVPDIDLVLCSPSARTRQTWRLVSAELGGTPESHVESHIDKRIYTASPTDLLSVVRDLPASAGTALVIGHNPGLEELVSLLADVPCELRTSSVAVVAGPGGWADAGPGWGRLVESDTPRA